MSQFNFDIMDAAGYGYYRVWKERMYLLKLATIPVVIKLATMIGLSLLDKDTSVLRQGLYLLPADFAKGWVLAQFLRTLLMNERWPIILNSMPDGAVLAKLLVRARGIVSSLLAFVLISMAGNATFALLLDNMPDAAVNPMKGNGSSGVNTADMASFDREVGDQNLAASLGLSVLSIGGLIGSIWLFRLLWLYIPYAVLFPMNRYLEAMKGFMSSIKLLILYFSCMAPIMLLTVMLSRGAYGFFEGVSGNNQAGQFVAILLTVIADFLVALVTTAAMAWSMRQFLPHAAGAMDDMPQKGKE